MFETALLSIVLLGVASLLHCSVMCGCLSNLLMSGSATQQSEHPRLRFGQKSSRFLAHQSGRITTYSLLGFVFGLVGESGSHLLTQMQLHNIMPWIAAAVTVYVGLSVTNLLPGLNQLEKCVFSRFSQLLPKPSPNTRAHNSFFTAYTLGLLWGLLPCGLIYSALLISLTSANAWQSSLLMLLFGLLTIPGLVTVTLFGNFLQHFTHNRQHVVVARITLGSILIITGIGLLFLPIHQFAHVH